MIEHKGIVENISGNRITVRILQRSACSDCHAKELCMAADSKEKRVEIIDGAENYSINEPVIIQGKESIGYKAVLVAFVLPLILLITVLIVATSVWKMKDYGAALVAIVSLIPYYLLLNLLRYKMENSFKFTIKKIN